MLVRHVEGEPEEYRLLRESLLKLIDLEHNRRNDMKKKDKVAEHMRSALRNEKVLQTGYYHYVGKLKDGGNEVWEGDDDYLVLTPKGEWKRVPYIPMGTTYDDLEDA